MTSKKWMFNENITSYTNSSGSYITSETFSISFVSNNASYSKINFKTDGASRYLKYDETEVQYLKTALAGGDGKSHWIDESYKAITLSEEPTGDFLLYLQTNATEIVVSEIPFKWGGGKQ